MLWGLKCNDRSGYKGCLLENYCFSIYIRIVIDELGKCYYEFFFSDYDLTPFV